MELPKTEYNFLLGFYLNLSIFEPMTSTFTFLTEPERREILLTISVLKRKLEEVMPKVQDKEAR
jgi:hypothetical protein